MRDHRMKKNQHLNVRIYEDTYYRIKDKCKELRLPIDDVVQLILDTYFNV